MFLSQPHIKWVSGSLVRLGPFVTFLSGVSVSLFETSALCKPSHGLTYTVPPYKSRANFRFCRPGPAFELKPV